MSRSLFLEGEMHRHKTKYNSIISYIEISVSSVCGNMCLPDFISFFTVKLKQYKRTGYTI